MKLREFDNFLNEMAEKPVSDDVKLSSRSILMRLLHIINIKTNEADDFNENPKIFRQSILN